jgi:hypothetical protein
MKTRLIKTLKRYSRIYHFVGKNDCVELWSETLQPFDPFARVSYDTGVRMNFSLAFAKNYKENFENILRTYFGRY